MSRHAVLRLTASPVVMFLAASGSSGGGTHPRLRPERWWSRAAPPAGGRPRAIRCTCRPLACPPGTLARIPGVSVADSRIIHDARAANGFLDAQDDLTDDPDLNASGWHAVIPAPYGDAPVRHYVAETLDNAWSAHGFYSVRLPRTLRSFEPVIAARGAQGT